MPWPERPVVQDSDGDPLPPGALFRFGTARFRKSEAFRATALSADGKRLAASGAASVTVWDLATGRAVREFPPMSCDLVQGGRLAFLDGDRRLAVSTQWNTSALTTGFAPNVRGLVARVWDVESGKTVGDLVVKDEAESGGAGGVWAVDGGRKLLTLSSLRIPVRQAGRTPGRKAVAIVWDAATLKELERQVHDLPVTEVLDYAPAADRVFGRRLSDPANVSGEPGDTLCVFDRKTGKEIWSQGR